MRRDHHEQLAVLRGMLARVNAEWRDLARQSGSEAKLSRMCELRSQRLALMSEVFDLEQRVRKAG